MEQGTQSVRLRNWFLATVGEEAVWTGARGDWKKEGGRRIREKQESEGWRVVIIDPVHLFMWHLVPRGPETARRIALV